MRNPRAHPGRLAALLLVLVASSCAATLERSNRFFYGFNQTLDCAGLRPVSEVYHGVVPGPVQNCVSNAFDNFTYLNVSLNGFLQGKGKQGGSDLLRFLVNSTLGIGGLFDVASKLGLEEHDEDFGQTLGVWGVPSGPYLVLPGLGPSSVRDAWQYPIGFLTNPFSYVPFDEGQTSFRIVQAIDLRTRNRDRIRRRDESAMDPYVFTMEAYLQRRAFLVADGEGEELQAADELDDLLEEVEDF